MLFYNNVIYDRFQDSCRLYPETFKFEQSIPYIFKTCCCSPLLITMFSTNGLAIPNLPFNSSNNITSLLLIISSGWLVNSLKNFFLFVILYYSGYRNVNGGDYDYLIIMDFHFNVQHSVNDLISGFYVLSVFLFMANETPLRSLPPLIAYDCIQV